MSFDTVVLIYRQQLVCLEGFMILLSPDFMSILGLAASLDHMILFHMCWSHDTALTDLLFHCWVFCFNETNMDLKIFTMKRKSRCQWDWFCVHESHAAGLFVDATLHIQCNTSSSSGSKKHKSSPGRNTDYILSFTNSSTSFIKEELFFPQKLLVHMKYMLLKTAA